jgi:hypothetical protein
MEDEIMAFIEKAISLPRIPISAAVDEHNSYEDHINDVNVVGSRSILPVYGTMFCVSSGGRPIENVKEVMSAFQSILGEPALTSFYVVIKWDICPMWLKQKATVNFSNVTYVRFVLPPEIPNSENWTSIDELRQVLGEPANGEWSFSIFHYWQTVQGSIKKLN